MARLSPLATSAAPARGVKREWKSLREIVLLGVAVMGLGAGGLLYLAEARSAARATWAATTSFILIPTIFAVGRGLLRRETGVDIIAVMAMVGALSLGEPLAGAIIAVMLTGGAALERFAVARARRELSALLERAPRIAHRRAGPDVVDVTIEQVSVGDRLVVKPGEVVPADGILDSDSAILDESALTGEARPAQVGRGAPVRSGGTNAGGPPAPRRCFMSTEV